MNLSTCKLEPFYTFITPKQAAKDKGIIPQDQTIEDFCLAPSTRSFVVMQAHGNSVTIFSRKNGQNKLAQTIETFHLNPANPNNVTSRIDMPRRIFIRNDELILVDQDRIHIMKNPATLKLEKQVTIQDDAQEINQQSPRV